jgi:hypothetical protein
LTRESGSDQVDIADTLQLANIVCQSDVRKAGAKHAARSRIALTKKSRAVTGAVQAELNATDASE